MLRKSFKAGAAVIGGAVLATTILTGCAGPKITLDGTEVSNMDKAIESADSLWAQNRASGTASNVDKDSRCYAQANDVALAKQAICGPIHYLGDDDQVWETMEWKPAGEGKDKVQLTAVSSFSKGTPAPNATMYRPDGKKAPEGLQVPEPDTKSADALQAIWSSTRSSFSSDTMKTHVQTPDATIDLTNWKVSDRTGSASDRIKAGDGNKFVSIDLRMNNGATSTSVAELAFVSGGKNYPAGKAKNGNLAMALPGDGKDAALAITYDGLTQTVSLADGKLESKAAAYYSGLAQGASSPTLEPIKVGEKIGTSVTFQPKGFTAELTAYEKKAGWAPEGKAWLVVTGSPDHGALEDRVASGGGFSSISYDAPTKVKTATVKNVSGAPFSSEAKRIDNTVDSGFFITTTKSTVVFEVPVGVGDFSVSLTLNATGGTSTTSNNSDKHPATVSIDGTVPPFELTFEKQK